MPWPDGRTSAGIAPCIAIFLINTGEASAADLEILGEQVRTKVKTQSGIELRWEIKRIGEPRKQV
jgi:UDP-N-acetylmuramate dehydrogenase